MEDELEIPAVLSFAGLDPTGGAGLQADIEALASMGAHGCPVATALTVQDTRTVHRIMPVPLTDIVEQARAVLEDISVAAVKVGLLGSVGAAEAVHSILSDYPDLPVVVDPVLASGDGTPLADADLVEALRVLVLPLATVATPNSLEARRLAPEADSLEACAQEILDLGTRFVLVTGAHEPGEAVSNVLYGNHRLLERYDWARLPHDYHGSGCTLSAAIAGLLAHGLEPYSAIAEAQEYTWEALRHGTRPGLGQHLPNRFFWAHEEEA